MNKEDIGKGLNEVSENMRHNKKKLDKLINKFRKTEMSESETLKGGIENEI